MKFSFLPPLHPNDVIIKARKLEGTVVWVDAARVIKEGPTNHNVAIGYQDAVTHTTGHHCVAYGVKALLATIPDKKNVETYFINFHGTDILQFRKKDGHEQ